MLLIVSRRKNFLQTWNTLLRPTPRAADIPLIRGTVAEAVTLAENTRLTLAVVDSAQFDKGILRTDGELAQLAKRTHLLLAESNLGADTELAALALGIVGCCPSNLSEAELRKIVDVVTKGGIWVSRAALPNLLNQLRQAAPRPVETAPGERLAQLTPREREIALCVAQGAPNKLIAKRLSVSDVTVKAHLTAIFHKLGVSGRVQLALLLSDHQHPPSPLPGINSY